MVDPKSGMDARFFETKKKGFFLVLILICLFLISGFAVTCGAYNISVRDVGVTLAAHLTPFKNVSEINKLHNTIIWNIRLPRILLTITVGVALSASGALFQGCFRNPLVEPYILGVSSGAAFGAALGIVFPYFPLSVQALAFIFAFIAVLSAYAMARVRGESPAITLILAGVIIGSVFSALVGIMKYIAPEGALREIVFWLMGGFYYATWNDILLIGPIVMACFTILLCYGWRLNILSMGDQEARALGLNPEMTKMTLVFLATLITAVSVSAVGIIAWVGLMMPHAARMMLGPDHRFVLPAAAALGGIYLIVCDTLARTLTCAEIPIGIITSILGAPYLFYLLRSKGRSAFTG
jgi:iron complex transport system permease protein